MQSTWNSVERQNLPHRIPVFSWLPGFLIDPSFPMVFLITEFLICFLLLPPVEFAPIE